MDHLRIYAGQERQRHLEGPGGVTVKAPPSTGLYGSGSLACLRPVFPQAGLPATQDSPRLPWRTSEPQLSSGHPPPCPQATAAAPSATLGPPNPLLSLQMSNPRQHLKLLLPIFQRTPHFLSILSPPPSMRGFLKRIHSSNWLSGVLPEAKASPPCPEESDAPST